MWSKIRAWRRNARDAEIEREIRNHLALEAEERRDEGLSARDAQDAARRVFGNVTLAREDTRAVWAWTWAERLAQDLRYALRLMRRSPLFTLVTVATLALGIGANTAIFTLVDAVLLKTLPVAAPERLVILNRLGDRGQRYNVSYPLFERLREQTGAFAGVLAAEDGISQVEMRGPEAEARVEHAVLHLVSGEYFSVLGTSAFIGRTLTPDDNRPPGGHPVAVLSHAFWIRRFGGDLSVLGARITLGKEPLTVIGVARPGFFGEVVGRAPDVWAPLMMHPQFSRGRSYLADPRVGWLRVMARLRDGVTPAAAEAALTLALDRLAAAGDETVGSSTRRLVARVEVVDGGQGLTDFRDEYARPLRVLTGVVVLVLLVACANVSGLLLARARARRQEVTVRLAIGAGRLRIVRQFLTESLLLAAVGGALGVALAWQGSRLLLRLISTTPIPVAIDVTPDARTLIFTAVAALTTVVVFGLAPALAAARTEAGPPAERATPRTRTTFSRLLVISQTTLSLVLLTGAVLFVMTLHNLRTQDFGFEPEALLQVGVDANASGYTREQQPALMRRLLDGVRGVPGVAAASTALTGYGSGGSHTCCIAIPGRVFAPDEDREIRTDGVGPGYFKMMRLPLVLGREFEAREIRDDFAPPQLAIVNEAFARRYYPGRSPVGERFGWGDPPKVSYGITIVGVARDASVGQLRARPKPMIYFPQFGGLLVVRAAGAPDALAASLRRAVAAVEPKVVLLGMRYVSEEIDRALVRERLLAQLSTAFGLVAALLTALGLYGLMAYGVVARTRELGIRLALGAPRGRVLAHEMRASLALVAVGVLVGAAIAPAAGALIASQLFGVTATDPRVLGLAALLLLLVSAAAAFVPARRAARVDPAVALHSD